MPHKGWGDVFNENFYFGRNRCRRSNFFNSPIGSDKIIVIGKIQHKGMFFDVQTLSISEKSFTMGHLFFCRDDGPFDGAAQFWNARWEFSC